MQLASFAFAVLMSQDDEIVPEPPILAKIREAKDKEAMIRNIEGGGDRSKDFIQLELLVNGPQSHEDGA
jgi:hypothetical protein